MSCRTIHTQAGVVEYSAIGHGSPILVLHGGHSSCREALCHKGFDPDKYRLITPSRPGYGKTTLEGNESPARAADLMLELLNHLEIDQVIVYGVSAGGLTAIEFAGRHPERVSRLILASAVTHKWFMTKSFAYWLAWLLFHPKLEKLTWSLVRELFYMAPELMVQSFHSQFSSVPIINFQKKDIKVLKDTLSEYRSGKGFHNDIKQGIDPDIFKSIQCPVLILHSEYDQSVPFEHAMYVHKMLPGSKLEKLQNNWGHLLWMGQDSANAINRILRFIEGQWPGEEREAHE